MSKIIQPTSDFGPILADLDARLKKLETAAWLQALTLVGQINGISNTTTSLSPVTLASTSFSTTRPANALVLATLKVWNSGGLASSGLYWRINLDGQLSESMEFVDTASAGGMVAPGTYSGTAFLVALNLGAGSHTLSVEGWVGFTGMTLDAGDGTVNALLIGP